MSDAGSFDYWLASGIFLSAFLLIVSEKMHKTKVALLGGALMVACQIVSQTEAFHSERFGIDYNVIFLLISMMLLVNIIGQSGVFEWAAVKSAKIARGRPMTIMLMFIVLTAVASAFLDNVTTVLLLAPVTLLIADELDIDPVPFLLAEVLASNIGGTATLIGDPPNIIIASKADLSFMDFITNLAPVVVVMLAAFMLAVRLLFAKRLFVTEEARQRILGMDESQLIKDRALAIKSLIVLGGTLVGFTLHGALHLEPATIALLGAAVLLAISKGNPAQGAGGRGMDHDLPVHRAVHHGRCRRQGWTRHRRLAAGHRVHRAIARQHAHHGGGHPVVLRDLVGNRRQTSPT